MTSKDRRLTCSRPEAVELALNSLLWSHAVVMVLVLSLELTVFGPAGIWVGLGAVAGLLAVMPVIVLPSAYFLGWLAHRLFHQTNVPVEVAVRIFAMLFEANLFGWIVMASLIFS